MKSGLNQYFEEVLLSPTKKLAQPKASDKIKVARTSSNKITLSQYFERELLEETTAAERMQEMTEQPDSIDEIYEEEANNEDEEIDIYTSYASYMSSSDPGSDNLLVTFDYGFEDSLDADLSLNSQELEILDKEEQLNKSLFKIPEEESSEDLLKVKHSEMYSKSPIIFKINDVQCSQDFLEMEHRKMHSKSAFKIEQVQSSENLLTVNHARMYSKSPNIFKVHQVKHLKGSTGTIDTRASSCNSVATSLVEYNIDTSGDYGSWAQCESEKEEGDCNEKTYRNYRYEDLIKNEELIYDDNDGNDILHDDNEREVLINFDFDEDQPPRWFNNNNINNNNNNNNEQLYYKSVDYLN